MNGRHLLVGLALGMTAMAGMACNTVECGEGTLEVDGVCVAGNPPGTPECGAGFHYDTESGTCRSLAFEDGGFGECDPNTTIVEVDDAGIPHCIGIGGGIDCNTEIACPTPSGGKMAICGTILNVANSQLLDADPQTGGPSEGVEVRLYEPLGFAADPLMQPTIAITTPDECGRYVFTDITPPSTGFIAVAVDDLAGSGNDNYLLTGLAFPAAPGKYASTEGWVTEMATVEAWGTQASVDFVAEGVYLPIFLDPAVNVGKLPGTPVAGVQVTEGITVFAANDFYFSDADPLTRTTIDTGQDESGANGSALMINTGLGNHSGTGAEPTDCNWPSNLSAAIGGVVFVQERIAECP